MELQEIKQINVTVLFSEPINHLLITPKEVVDLFKTGDEDLNQHSLIEAPGLKVFTFPKKQREVIFEANRLLINDKSGSSPKESKIIESLNSIMGAKMVSLEKIAAWGFNYDTIAVSKNKKIKPTDFISNKIAKIIKKVERAGVQLIFHKDKARFNFQTQPVAEDKLLVHLNVHYRGILPSERKLKESLAREFNFFISLIKKL